MLFFRLRVFDSGVMVIQSQNQDEKQMIEGTSQTVSKIEGLCSLFQDDMLSKYKNQLSCSQSVNHLCLINNNEKVLYSKLDINSKKEYYYMM